MIPKVAWLMVVTLPHLLYLYAYHYGPTLHTLIPHHEFIHLAILLRGLSILATVVLFYHTHFHTWDIYDWFSPYPFPFVGIVLILLGLNFNMTVYQQLGTSGVYYSCEMIQQCPRPPTNGLFSIIQHPMYVGAILILLGAMCLIGLHENTSLRLPIIIPLIYMIGLYLWTMIVESHDPMQKLNPSVY